ncbi:major capsid protein [Capybara microvirus Cap3_SP_443]|nr:major capsid protein [Capybara microvirus Cap3_SP_443]
MQRTLNETFSKNPVNLDMDRSIFTRQQSHKTTFSEGDLVPLYVDEILPGDTVTMDTAAIVRMQTPIFPVMGDAYLDTFWFFVPNRLVWTHWQEFMGENTHGKWAQEIQYRVPKIKLSQTDDSLASLTASKIKSAALGHNTRNVWTKTPSKGSILDYMGVPIVDPEKIQTDEDITKYFIGEFEINALPIRGYYKIYNDWFRDQNNIDPIEFTTGDETVTPQLGEGKLTPASIRGGLEAPLKAAKFHDLFTSAARAPQKGPAVSIDLGMAPVVGDGSELSFIMQMNGESNKYALRMGDKGSNEVYPLFAKRIGVDGDMSPNLPWVAEKEAGTSIVTTQTGLWPMGYSQAQNTQRFATSGLQVNGKYLGFTVNELRLSFQVQKMLEKWSRGGSRYIETLKEMFGVTSPDSRLQRPEYLGGERVSINMATVVQQSSSDGTTPQGNVAGVSSTAMTQNSFTKSFVEHGYLFCLGVVRVEHSYEQGLEKMWTKDTIYDFYWPALANIGEVSVYNRELYLKGMRTHHSEPYGDSMIWGYQEPWYDYRYKPNRVSGAMRKALKAGLSAYHYGDYYGEQPLLSNGFIEEGEQNVNDVIAVQSNLEDQFIADFFFKGSYSRVMPVYSVPGLIDHH